MRRAALLLSLVFATTAFAQETQTLDMRPKHGAPLDGSLAITKSHGTGFDLTLGGTAVKDRVWFFASAERMEPMFAQTTAAPVRAFDTKMIANISDRQNLSATFSNTTASTPVALAVPSNFLSLHYTATLSSNSFFTMSYSDLRR